MPPIVGTPCISGLDELCDLVAEKSGETVNEVTDALDILRARGFTSLASGVQAISKYRNFEAHPRIAKLKRELRSAFESASTAEQFDIASEPGDGKHRRWADIWDSTSDGSTQHSGAEDREVDSVSDIRSAEGKVVTCGSGEARRGQDQGELEASKRECRVARELDVSFGGFVMPSKIARVASFSWEPKASFAQDGCGSGVNDDDDDYFSLAVDELESFAEEFDLLIQARDDPTSKQRLRCLVRRTAQRLEITPKELLAFAKEVYKPDG
jgi:hypothetical protein